MRAQEATPLLLALAAGHRRQGDDDEDESQEQQSSSSPQATVTAPPRAAYRRSKSPSLAVIHEVGPAHERDSSSYFSSSTPDVYENYNTLSTEVVWPPQGISWPPQYSPTSSSSSSSSSSQSFDIEDIEDEMFRAPSRSSRQLRRIQLLIIYTAMISIPMVAFVSILQSREYFDSPLHNNKKGGSSTRDHSIPNYSRLHHRHFHRIVEKSYLTDMNHTESSDATVFDINTIPTNISFGALASIMVPIYFQTTVDLCVATIAPNSNNTIDVMPDEVFVLRKTILKTRDLLDVFAPVYPRKLRLLGHTKKGKKKDKKKDGGKGKHRSKSEEALHKMRMNHHSVVDVWKILRRFLDDGYMLIGDFQDLSHAKVKYTPERLHIYQVQVWNWKEEFVAFVAQNHEGIMEYLSHACPDKAEKQDQELSLANIKTSQLHRKEEEKKSCSYFRSKSSHLFWKNTPSSQLPDGNIDEASTVLAQLGSAQLTRALAYLILALASEHVVGDQAVNKDVHELYHNCRKEIRSFLDSVDLFGQLLFPDKSFEQHDENISLLKQTKKLLGDLNDEVVAYSKYLEWNEYPEEQLQLKSFITADWGEFRRWADEVDLNGKLHSLADAMANAQNEGSLHRPKSLDSYLKEQKKNPTRSFVIGNDAGDADSIISAICLAFIEEKTPIISVSKDTFVYERPEVEMLLDLAGISNASANLLFIEDLQMILDSSKDNEVRTLTLVDQNTINDSLHKFRHMIEVVEIVDHHTDENLYTDTCSGTMRNIAFENGKALVASTTALIAEMLLKRTNNPQVSLSTLLLGVILLDSVNLDESIGKVTPRDRDAVSNILTQTDWSNSSLLAYLKPSAGSQPTIDTNQLFSHLERAKYSPEFWSAFNVSRALGYDYKAFHYGTKNSKHRFGIATILMPGNQFMEKEGFLPQTTAFMRSKELTFLGIMLTFYDQTTGDFRRQLAFCSNRYRRGMIGDDLIESKMYTYLALKEITSQQLTSDEIECKLYEQGNIAPSRKQLGPMLVEFFASEQDK